MDDGGLASSLASLGAPFEEQTGIALKVQELLRGALCFFAARYQEEFLSNLPDPATRENRPGSAKWDLVAQLYLQGDPVMAGIAAHFYRSALKLAPLMESGKGLKAKEMPLKGVEWCNLGAALLATHDYDGALEAFLNAAAEDKRYNHASHAEENVLKAALLKPAEDAIARQVLIVLPTLGDTTQVDEGLLPESDVRLFCQSLDLPRRLYLHRAVRRGAFHTSDSDLGKMERLTATREITMLVESDLRLRLKAASVAVGPKDDLGHLLPRYAKHFGYSKSPWFRAVVSTAKYHGGTKDNIDCRVGKLEADDLHLGTDREKVLARSLLMAWLLRNFSNHDLQIEVELFREAAGFYRPFAYLLAAPVIIHLMSLGTDFLNR